MSFSPRFVKLSEVTTLRNGAGIKQENFTDESNGIPLVKVSNFTQNSIDMSDLTMVNFDHAQKWKSHVIQRGNILIATVGSWPPNWSSVVGKVVRAPKNAEGSIQNQNTCCLIPTEELHEGYLYYKLKDPKFLEWVVNIAQGSANQARVPVKKLGEYQFELPPMEVQKSIANALESLDLKISANSQINQTLEEMAQAIFKSWFVDFDPVKAKMNGEQPAGMDAATASLFPEKLVESELGLIPDGWEVKPLGDYLTIKRGGSPRPIKEFIVPDGYPWTKIADATANDNPYIFKTKEFIREEGLKKTVYLKKGTLILSNSATPGLPRFLDLDACIHDGWLHFPEKKHFTDSYLYQLFLHIRKHLVSQGNGSVFTNLKTDILRNQVVLVPPKELVDIYEIHAGKILETVKAKSIENNQLAQLRDTLLPKLLSGEIELGGEG